SDLHVWTAMRPGTRIWCSLSRPYGGPGRAERGKRRRRPVEAAWSIKGRSPLIGSAPTDESAGALPVDVVPLGGLGEFGLNMMAISCGETTILIDAGTMFPDADLPGVDLIIQDLAYLESRKGQVKALVLTHGHEDHIGAVPYVLPHVDGPVYGTPLALALVAPKLEEHDIEHGPGLVPIKPLERVTIGPF